MDTPSLLIGLLVGFVIAAAIFFGTEFRWDRRKPQSRTPDSIQNLFAGVHS